MAIQRRGRARAVMNRRQFVKASASLAASGLACPSYLLCAQGSRASGFARFDQPAKALLARMTLEEKIGQMVQAEHSSLKDPADIEQLFLGSLLAGGNADPKTGNGLVD